MRRKPQGSGGLEVFAGRLKGYEMCWSCAGEGAGERKSESVSLRWTRRVLSVGRLEVIRGV